MLYQIAIATAFVLISTLSSNAAVIEYSSYDDVFDGRGEITLSGSVEVGDREKLVSAVEAIWSETSRSSDITIILDSQGGSYHEAILIARYIAETWVRTRVRSGSECFSACAIIFLSGSYNTESGKGIITSRTVEVGAKLGFHAPFIQIGGNGRYTSDTVEEAFSAGVQAVLALSEISEIAQIDGSLLNEIIKVGSDDFFLIETVDHFGRWQIDIDNNFSAIEPSTINHLLNLCINAFAWQANTLIYSYPGLLKFPYSTSSSELKEYFQTSWGGDFEGSHDNGNPRKYVLSNPVFGGDATTCIVNGYSEDSYQVHFTGDFSGFPWRADAYTTRVSIPSWAIQNPDENW